MEAKLKLARCSIKIVTTNIQLSEGLLCQFTKNHIPENNNNPIITRRLSDSWTSPLHSVSSHTCVKQHINRWLSQHSCGQLSAWINMYRSRQEQHWSLHKHRGLVCFFSLPLPSFTLYCFTPLPSTGSFYLLRRLIFLLSFHPSLLWMLSQLLHYCPSVFLLPCIFGHQLVLHTFSHGNHSTIKMFSVFRAFMLKLNCWCFLNIYIYIQPFLLKFKWYIQMNVGNIQIL